MSWSIQKKGLREEVIEEVRNSSCYERANSPHGSANEAEFEIGRACVLAELNRSRANAVVVEAWGHADQAGNGSQMTVTVNCYDPVPEAKG